MTEDSQVIDQCLSGDVEAFGALVTKYQASILHFAWTILGDREEAGDVTQEAFLQSYVHLRRFDKTRSFKTWLCAIAYRRCLDRKKRERFFRDVIREWGSETELSSEDGKVKDRIETSEIFGRFFMRLNEKERTAAILKINEGYTAKEIAEILGCAESTARVYVFNAKRKLRKFLKGRKGV